MKRINYIPFLLLIFGLVACQSNDPKSSTKEGAISLLMDAREGIDIPIIMKSRELSLVDVDTFHIVIKDAGGKPIQQSFDTFEELRNEGMPLVLPIGSYTAEASSGILPDAAFAIPCYRAIKNFIIEENTVSEVNLHCTPQSLKVTLEYTDNFHNQINPDYEITVTNGVGTLLFTKEEIRAGYFSVQQPIILHLIGTSKDFGTHVNFAVDLKHINGGVEQPLKKGDHLIVTLDVEKISPVIKSIELQ